jgi:hypothetical protein
LTQRSPSAQRKCTTVHTTTRAIEPTTIAFTRIHVVRCSPRSSVSTCDIRLRVRGFIQVQLS